MFWNLVALTVGSYLKYFTLIAVKSDEFTNQLFYYRGTIYCLKLRNVHTGLQKAVVYVTGVFDDCFIYLLFKQNFVRIFFFLL